ncbi:MAG: hypothetical protein D6689_14390 [Deltaproteobacteria bacterium]|nr:MAG: hypothetical protein D6689_14390 [Deltaproteobacteria bacterium]
MPVARAAPLPPSDPDAGSVALDRCSAQLLELYPTDLRGELADELDDVVRDAMALAREVDRAERDGVAFADAAQQPERFPLMARVHHGAIELLQTELAPGERAALAPIVARASGVEAEALRRAWFALAADERAALSAPLMRFLLYQAVRLNVWVLTWSGGAPLEATGALREFDARAEDMLRARLDMTAMRDPAVRPLRVLVAEALEQLAAIWERRREELRAGSADSARLVAGLVDAAQVARDLGASDAVLVRNELAGATGGDQLGSRDLAARSPACASQNAVDQRRRRLLDRLRRGDRPRPSGTRLIDLLGPLG